MPSTAAKIDVFRAIADPTRRAVLDLLRHKERSVSDLAKPFHMSQPAVSQHLRVLRQAGLITPTRRGRHQLYRVNQKPLRKVYDWLSHYQHFWNNKLGQLNQLLEEMDEE